ncbi:MAG: hypothetical protein GY795_43495 [Desulfobacterales bacterium]|nr:hypothetical protein [Desulfobacterales bacterium]
MDITAKFKIKEYTITSSAGENGSIFPFGEVIVTHGENKEFIITPDHGHHIFSVMTDSTSANPLTTHLFENVTDNHTIHAAFKPNMPPDATTDYANPIFHNSATLNGKVNPNGLATTYYFEYGTTEDYEFATTKTDIGSEDAYIQVSADIDNIKRQPSTSA